MIDINTKVESESLSQPLISEVEGPMDESMIAISTSSTSATTDI